MVTRTGAIKSFVTFSLIFVAAVLGAAVLGIDVSILIAITVIGFGAVGLTAALTLGLRELSRNVTASRYVSDSVAEGERISVNGVSGTVESLGRSATTLRGDDGRSYVVPNAHFLEHVVEKESSLEEA